MTTVVFHPSQQLGMTKDPAKSVTIVTLSVHWAQPLHINELHHAPQ